MPIVLRDLDTFSSLEDSNTGWERTVLVQNPGRELGHLCHSDRDRQRQALVHHDDLEQHSIAQLASWKVLAKRQT